MTHLPVDNPSDFLFFYDSSGRRQCNVSPERFVKGKGYFGDLTPEMDVFSLGCIIYEIFLDGKCLFTLSELLSYKKGDIDASNKLDEIPDEYLRKLIHRMISLNPKQRITVSECLSYL